VASEPGYRHRQIRRHAGQLVRLARRALGRPWYRRRLSEAAAKDLGEAVGAVRAVVRDRRATDKLHAALDRLETLFDRHLGFMKYSVYVEYAGQIGLAVLAAFVLRESVVEAFKIPSGSMLPTLEVGDHIFVNKLEYGVRVPFTSWLPVRYAAPHRGDVVVFEAPHASGDAFIKRIVAVEGDLVRVDRAGALWINERKVRRCLLGTGLAPERDEPQSRKVEYDFFLERLGDVVFEIRQRNDRSLGGLGGGEMPGRGVTASFPAGCCW